MDLKDIENEIDQYYPKGIKYDDIFYSESVAHQNFLKLLIDKVQQPNSKDYHNWKKHISEIAHKLNKKIIGKTNSQFPVFSCYYSYQEDHSETVSRIKTLEVSLSLIAKVFYINEYIDNENLINSKRYRTKSIQIVHTEKYCSDEVRNLIHEVKKCYPKYSFCNHHFLLLKQEDYYPPIMDLEKVSLYHLLFGKEPHYPISLIHET